jgi:hypothetical protein
MKNGFTVRIVLKELRLTGLQALERRRQLGLEEMAVLMASGSSVYREAEVSEEFARRHFPNKSTNAVNNCARWEALAAGDLEEDGGLGRVKLAEIPAERIALIWLDANDHARLGKLHQEVERLNAELEKARGFCQDAITQREEVMRQMIETANGPSNQWREWVDQTLKAHVRTAQGEISRLVIHCHQQAMAEMHAEAKEVSRVEKVWRGSANGMVDVVEFFDTMANFVENVAKGAMSMSQAMEVAANILRTIREAEQQVPVGTQEG